MTRILILGPIAAAVLMCLAYEAGRQAELMHMARAARKVSQIGYVP